MYLEICSFFLISVDLFLQNFLMTVIKNVIIKSHVLPCFFLICTYNVLNMIQLLFCICNQHDSVIYILENIQDSSSFSHYGQRNKVLCKVVFSEEKKWKNIVLELNFVTVTITLGKYIQRIKLCFISIYLSIFLTVGNHSQSLIPTHQIDTYYLAF